MLHIAYALCYCRKEKHVCNTSETDNQIKKTAKFAIQAYKYNKREFAQKSNNAKKYTHTHTHEYVYSKFI